MIPGGRVNPRQMRQAMKRMGIEQEELEGVEEVIIRTASKEYVIRDPNVTAMTAQGQKIWTVVGEPIVRDRVDAKKPDASQGLAIPEEDVQLRSEEHTSELQSQSNLVCRLLLEKKNKRSNRATEPWDRQPSSHSQPERCFPPPHGQRHRPPAIAATCATASIVAGHRSTSLM